MSRKDYQLIADAIAGQRLAIKAWRPEMQEGAEAAIANIQSALAARLLDDNPRFDPYRFGKACISA